MSEKKRDFSFRAYAWRQFKKNKPALFSLYFLLFLIVIAILAPVLSNDEPLYVKYKGNSLFPAISFASYSDITDENGNKERLQYDVVDWKKLNVETVVWAPIVYSPGKTDLLNAGYIPPDGDQLYRDETGQIVSLPKRFWHWLGTSKRGEDVLAGLIHGTRISLTIGILSMSIASILGIFFGSMAGYFGDHRLSVSRGTYWFTIIGSIIAFYYAFQLRSYVISDALSSSGFNIAFQLLLSLIILIGITFIFNLIGRLLGFIPFFRYR